MQIQSKKYAWLSVYLIRYMTWKSTSETLGFLNTLKNNSSGWLKGETERKAVGVYRGIKFFKTIELTGKKLYALCAYR